MRVLTLLFVLLVPTLALAEPAAVVLEKPGKGKKTELRYAVPAGQVEDVRFSMDMNMTMNMGGMKLPMVMPTTRFGVVTEIGATTDEGHIPMSFRFTEVELVHREGVMEGLSDEMMIWFDGLGRISGTCAMDTRGQTTSLTFVYPDDIDAELRETLEDLTSSFREDDIPFPEERVGVGAVWSRTQELTTDEGVEVRQVERFQLVKRKGQTIELTRSVAQTPTGTTFEFEGSKLALTSYSYEDEGTLTLDLTRTSPLTWTQTQSTDIEGSAGGTPMGVAFSGTITEASTLVEK